MYIIYIRSTSLDPCFARFKDFADFLWQTFGGALSTYLLASAASHWTDFAGAVESPASDWTDLEADGILSLRYLSILKRWIDSGTICAPIGQIDPPIVGRDF